MEIVLASILDTLVGLIRALGILTVVCFTGIWAWVGLEQLNIYLTRRRSWQELEQAREDLAEDFAKDESMVSFDFPSREYTSDRRSA